MDIRLSYNATKGAAKTSRKTAYDIHIGESDKITIDDDVAKQWQPQPFSETTVLQKGSHNKHKKRRMN